MLIFKSMMENRNTGSIASFKENLDAIVLGKAIGRLNEKKIDIECPIHGKVDALIGGLMIDGKMDFTVLESCCQNHKDVLRDFL